MTRSFIKNISALILLPILLLLAIPTERAFTQGQTKWIQVGSLQNWFSEKGWEIEEGNVRQQQYGLMWPAQYAYQSNQAAKGMWIGTTNFTDERGVKYTGAKVVHVGPRVNGDNEFFPETFDLFAKFDPPRVFVDGNPTFKSPEDLKGVDETMKADRMLLTVVNTSIGLKVERRIFAFSQQHHDNYHIFEFTFTNTGNSKIGLASKTLTGLSFYWQYRYSVCAEIRYCVSNDAGWGINAMNDARGFPPDIANTTLQTLFPNQNDVKAMFTWHGFHKTANRPPAGSSPNAATYDNIGAPIWNPSASAGYVASSDTNWRLGGAQFVGNAHIYADKSPTEKVSDPNQPTTTNFIGSDEPLTRNNSQYNSVMMDQEYAKMTEGHQPRHAWLVEPQGKFTQQTVQSNIGVGAPGGFSSGMGYGPYTLAPGQSIKIVFVEAVNGLTRDEAVRLGKKYKEGIINTKAKNDSVFLGMPRLLETFRRAMANYNSGFKIPEPPYPPSVVKVNGGGNKIAVTWEPNAKESANGFVGYRVYRATGRVDSTYYLMFQCGGNKPATSYTNYSSSKIYSFDDETAIRGISYYYYVVSFTNPIAADAATKTPAGELESSRFYTQTYDATTLKRPAGPAAQMAYAKVTRAYVKDSTKIEFESVSGENFSVADFKLITFTKGVRTVIVPAAGQVPLDFKNVTAGTKKSFTLPVDTTSVDSVFYQVWMLDVSSENSVKMYVGGQRVDLPADIVKKGKASDAIRIAPNPYIISSNENRFRFPSEGDKIAFFNVPANCLIKIYTELGELIKEIVHNDGTGDAYWNSITSSNQVVVSGVYIVVIEDKDTGEKIMKKLVVIR
ncbi:MAG: hypothetical protein V1799_20950 [bacterium]